MNFAGEQVPVLFGSFLKHKSALFLRLQLSLQSRNLLAEILGLPLLLILDQLQLIIARLELPLKSCLLLLHERQLRLKLLDFAL